MEFEVLIENLNIHRFTRLYTDPSCSTYSTFTITDYIGSNQISSRILKSPTFYIFEGGHATSI